MPDGSMVACQWPKKRPYAPTARQLLARQTFAETVAFIKNPDEEDMKQAVDLSKGTSLLWRDVLMMAANGTLFTVKDAAGNTYFGARTVSQTIQNLLDGISDEPGTILGRTASGWQVLLPATQGFVLTSQGAGNSPLWAPPASGGGGGGALSFVETIVAAAQTDVEFLGLLPGFSYSIKGYIDAPVGSGVPMIQLGSGNPPVWDTTSGNYAFYTYRADGQSGWTYSTNGLIAGNAFTYSKGTFEAILAGNCAAPVGVRECKFHYAPWTAESTAIHTNDTGYNAIKLFWSNGSTITGTFNLYKLQEA